MSGTSVASISEARHKALSGRFLIVSDRLPIVLTRDESEGWHAAPAAGALISALAPVLRDHRGTWIGWPGVSEEEVPALREVLAGAIQAGGYPLRPVSLTEQEKRGCYGGFSGEVIWPLFHDLQLECNFDPAYWRAYQKVNRKFARAVANALSRKGSRSDFVWVHDHLLMSVAAELRKLGTTATTAFFSHLPFPSPDVFVKMPWRDRLLASLLAYDQVGFQTPRDLVNFLDCVRLLVPGVYLEPCGGRFWSIRGAEIDLKAGAFPIGVDFQDLASRAAQPEVESRAAALSATFGGRRGRRMILGVDRLDRSKGIVEKLRAFAEALARYPKELREKVVLVQIVVPSREELPRHAALRTEIERLVGEINGRFGGLGWTPVHYLYRSLDPLDLLAHYRAADVALVTPLKAGMNLVAKELCAAHLDGRAALVLSEFAGAAAQLADGALLVNPYDARATARTLVRALRLPPEERAARMRKLRDRVRREDISWWTESFLEAALAGSAAEPSRRETAGLASYR